MMEVRRKAAAGTMQSSDLTVALESLAFFLARGEADVPVQS